MRMLDNQDVVRRLRSEVERAGGQSAWARRERIDRALLNRVLCGRKPPPEKIIRALKLCNVYALDGPEDRRNGRVDSASSDRERCNGRKGAKGRPRRRKLRSSGTKAKTRVGRKQEFRAELEKKLEERTRELAEAREHLAEALEQQTATSDVLQVISRSPGKLEPVFQSVLENATRICDAQFGNLYLCEGDAFRIVAMHGAAPAYAEARKHDPLVRPPPDSALGRVAITKQPAHITDIKTTRSHIERDPFLVS